MVKRFITIEGNIIFAWTMKIFCLRFDFVIQVVFLTGFTILKTELKLLYMLKVIVIHNKKLIVKKKCQVQNHKITH